MNIPEKNHSTAVKESFWPDARLVSECLRGDERAWSLLINKYKNLIYSIPLKNGLSSDDAAEIFQSVCVSLLSELPKLREPKALPAWLIRVTYHRCLHCKRELQLVLTDDREAEEQPDADATKLPEDQVQEVELEQKLREAVASLSPRCRRLIDMLFYETPTKPYQEIAQDLGLAKGSIGFIRRRCLERLRKKLEKTGFRG